MNPRTRFVMIFMGAALLLSGLTGCGVQGQKVAGGQDYRTFYAQTVNGRTIPCVGTSGGLSCDWSQK